MPQCRQVTSLDHRARAPRGDWLETFCRAVIAGGLVERRKRPDGSRWRLTYDDEHVLNGTGGWAGLLWPALPWVRVDEEQFAAYTDPPGRRDASELP
jgi:hypothetical protein